MLSLGLALAHCGDSGDPDGFVTDGGQVSAGGSTSGAEGSTSGGATATTGGGTTAGTSTSTSAGVTTSTGTSTSTSSTGSDSGESTGEGVGTSTGEGSTGEGSTGEAGSTGGDTEAPLSLVGDVWPIFADKCGCHNDSNGAGKLKLSESNAYDKLVGKPSKQVPEMLLVDPGSPETSYLWHKMNDTQDTVDGEGKVMPPGGKLKQDKLDLVEQWILQGAAP